MIGRERRCSSADFGHVEPFSRVMAGLVPAIHVLLARAAQERRRCPRRQACVACEHLAASAGMTMESVAIHRGRSASADSLPTGKITGYLQNFGRFRPRFGNPYINSLGDSNALRQIPCSIRNPDFFLPRSGNRSGGTGKLQRSASSSMAPFTIPHRPLFGVGC
jgi:hypothetical protein